MAPPGAQLRNLTLHCPFTSKHCNNVVATIVANCKAACYVVVVHLAQYCSCSIYLNRINHNARHSILKCNFNKSLEVFFSPVINRIIPKAEIVS